MAMELQQGQSDLLNNIRRGPQDALSLLSVDLGTCSLAALVQEVAARQPGLVAIVNTGLNSGVTRRGSAWPQFSQVRQDSVCGGLLVHWHHKLRVEEVASLASTDYPGVWLTVGGSPVAGGGRDRVTVVGIISCSEEVAGLEEHLASCVTKVRERFGQEVEVVVGGNRLLDRGAAGPVLQQLVWSPAGERQFLLHSPSLPLVPEGVPCLGRGAMLCSLRPTGCTVCSLGFHSEQELVQHRLTPEHRRAMVLASFGGKLSSLTQSPHSLGLEVSLLQEGVEGVSQEEGGLVTVITQPGLQRQFQLQLRNLREAPPIDGQKQGIVITQIAVPSGGVGVLELYDEHGVTRDEETMIRIGHSKRYKVRVTACCQDVGERRIPIVLVFYHDTFSELAPVAEGAEEEKLVSLMAVEVVVRVQTPELEAMLPLQPYVARERRVEYWRARETVKGHTPAQVFQEEADYLVTKLPLGNYPLGEGLGKLIAARFLGGADTVEEQARLQQARDVLEAELGMENYAERFQLLLHCEQFQEQKDVRYFDMEGVEVKLERSSGLVVLEVPGLQEGRPSVLKGDKLYLRECGSSRMVEYEAFVHQVGDTSVWLGCSDRLTQKLGPKLTWDVRFAIGLHPTKHMHRAVRLAQSLGLGASLFPSPSCLRTSQGPPSLSCYNPLVAANPEQRTAVEVIVAGLSGPAPYIVFGPPGTGKTVTLVEAIKQVWLHHPDSHILAAAPSNTAADLLAERLSEDVPSTEMLRLHASSRSRATVPPSLEQVSNLREEGFHFPALETIAQYRVIVTTLVTAGRLVSAQFPADHFQHIFIDEAGQATEPETMIAVAGLLTAHGLHTGGQLVMAGDPLQLGPSVRSPPALEHGLATSLLERLMASPLYSRGPQGYDTRCITKLVNNFRSHPALLQLPSRLFYSGELKPCAERAVVNSCLQFSGLAPGARARTPLIFHGVVGQDMREAGSPSFFNPAEAVTVLGYVSQLVEEGVQLQHIGVIAPYRRQVQKIRERLGLKGWREEVMVGTVEEFQGQERRVVIVTTVRSSTEYIVTDLQHKLGFLANPKRFNVAITRARALLVVVGNPYILQQDAGWKSLLDYSVQLGCYMGCPYPRDEQDEEEGQEKLTRLLLDQVDLQRLEETGWTPKTE